MILRRIYRIVDDMRDRARIYTYLTHVVTTALFIILAYPLLENSSAHGNRGFHNYAINR